jgi:hypothetical protein
MATLAHAVLAEDRRAAATGLGQTQQQFDGRTLAGAIRPQEAEDRVAGDM